MKQILLLTLSFLIFSCNSKVETVDSIIASNDIKIIKKKKDELTDQIHKLTQKINSLDTVVKTSLVTTFNVSESNFTHYIELQGAVKTKKNIVITPEFSGVLTNVLVREGQYVSKGQTLARIDDGGLSQQLAQYQIQVDLAKTTFLRQERLWNQKIGSEIQFLQAKSNYEAQAKAIDQIKSQLSKTSVRAPFSGTIDKIITEQGSVVSPGISQLFRIVNLNNMYIEAAVPETYVTTIKKNSKVKVDFPILGKSVNSKVRQTGNVINPANRTYFIEVDVPNKNKEIKPNLTAKLKINDYTNESAILIPQSVISENSNGEQYVYIVKDANKFNTGKATKIIIETGKTQGNLIEVTKGLVKDFKIIKEGARSVREGQDVKIVE